MPPCSFPCSFEPAAPCSLQSCTEGSLRFFAAARALGGVYTSACDGSLIGSRRAVIPQRPDPCPLGTSPIRHPNSGTTELRERRALRHFQPQYSNQKLPEHPLPRLGGVWGLLAISHEYWKNRYQPGAAVPADLLVLSGHGKASGLNTVRGALVPVPQQWLLITPAALKKWG